MITTGQAAARDFLIEATARVSQSASTAPPERAGAHAVEFAGHQSVRCGTPQMPRCHAQFPRPALRHAAATARSAVTPGPVHDRAARRATSSDCSTRLAIERVHFCGLSMGGMVGMWLGAHAPSGSIVWCCAIPRRRSAPPSYGTRASTQFAQTAWPSIADAVIERWFTPRFRQRDPEPWRACERCSWQLPRGLRRVAAPPCATWICAPCCARSSPTLVDRRRARPATTAADGAQHGRARSRARSHVELDAAHISNVEPHAFTARVDDFLTD